MGHLYSLLLTFFLIGVVLAAVYHSEIIAYRVGEPYGTLLLAFAITVIEVSLIIFDYAECKRLETISLARDTVFAAVMIILTGIIGICIVVGSIRYKQQLRFKDFFEVLKGISPKVLSFELSLLETYRLIEKNIEYTPTQDITYYVLTAHVQEI